MVFEGVSVAKLLALPRKGKTPKGCKAISQGLSAAPPLVKDTLLAVRTLKGARIPRTLQGNATRFLGDGPLWILCRSMEL
jgi:hypothetical protein